MKTLTTYPLSETLRRTFFFATLASVLVLFSHARAAEVRTEGPVASGGMKGIYVAPHAPTEHGKKILIITDFGFNDMETFYPYYRFAEHGCEVTVASINGGDVQGYGGHIMRDTKAIGDVDVTDFDVIYLPGGQAPAALRANENVIEAVQKFAETGRPIAAVCHGPQVLVTAGLVEGKNIACVADVGPEVTEAGGTYVDEPVSVDGQFVTSRLPKDLPLQMRTLIDMIENPEHQ